MIAGCSAEFIFAWLDLRSTPTCKICAQQINA
jgi:hypothetical protein